MWYVWLFGDGKVVILQLYGVFVRKVKWEDVWGEWGTKTKRNKAYGCLWGVERCYCNARCVVQKMSSRKFMGRFGDRRSYDNRLMEGILGSEKVPALFSAVARKPLSHGGMGW